MTEIKSALEIALERTKNVEASKESLEASKYNTEGKRLVSRFLNDENADLAKELKSFDSSKVKWVRAGIYEALSTNLILPIDEVAFKKSKRVREGFFCVIKDVKKLNRLMNQLENFLGEYLEERKRQQAAVEEQYAPRLRQKEEEMSKQLGAPVKIDPMQDPEFGQLLRKNMVMLEDRYSSVLKEVKQELDNMFGITAA
ncbi:MAG TPA: hypothetical protein ENI06_06930 [Spirochaetales bacterium]|nr:hypothetical protein [Spirochaetales bacterium]